MQRVRALCSPYPEFAEVEAWGRPTFRAGKKLFAVLGASMERPHSVVFKPDPEERLALIEDTRLFSPPYFGSAGWLAIGIDDPALDWSFVAELIDTSYRQVALKRQLAALDAHPVVPPA